MSTARQSYLCVPGWAEGSAGVTVGTMTASGGTVTRGDSAASRSLADFTQIAASSSTVTLSVDLAMNPSDSTLDGLYTVALVGVRVSGLTGDFVVRCKMTANAVDYFSAATIYCQTMNKALPLSTEGHQLFGSGVANIVFHDLPASAITSGVDFELIMDGAQAPSLNGKNIDVGSVFVGLQIPLNIDSKSKSWGADIDNDRHTKRSGGDISSDGVLLRNFQVEALAMPLSVLSGISDEYYDSDKYVEPNMLRAAIANIGSPMLMSLYPYPLAAAGWSGSPGAAEVEQRNLSRRQNFFALYGLMNRQILVSPHEQQGTGLGALYRTRMRFTEIR